MPRLVLPDQVETFIGRTREFLSELDCSLGEPETDEQNEVRRYRVMTADDNGELTVRRDPEAGHNIANQYRISYRTVLPAAIADFLRGKEEISNKFATLGAVVTVDDHVEIACQCVMPDQLEDTAAGILAAAISTARPSLLHSIRQDGSDNDERDVAAISSWSDLDFEQIHYDYAHEGLGNIGSRNWVMTLPFGARASLTAVDNNPYWGGGLLCLTHVPSDLLTYDGTPFHINILNGYSTTVDPVPCFGAWTRDEDDFVFVQFLPNMLKELPGLTDLVIRWSFWRASRCAQQASDNPGA